MDSKFKKLHIDENIKLMPICVGVSGLTIKEVTFVIKYGRFQTAEACERNLFAVYHNDTLSAYYISGKDTTKLQALSSAMNEFNCEYLLPWFNDHFILVATDMEEVLNEFVHESKRKFEKAYASLIIDQLRKGYIGNAEIPDKCFDDCSGFIYEKNNNIYLYKNNPQLNTFTSDINEIKNTLITYEDDSIKYKKNSYFDFLVLTAFSGCIVNRLQLNPIIVGVLSNKRANDVLGYLYASFNGDDSIVRIGNKSDLLTSVKENNYAFRVESGRKTANLTAAIDELRTVLKDNSIMIFDAQHLFPLDTGDCVIRKYMLLFDKITEFDGDDADNLYDYISTKQNDFVGEFKNYIYTISGLKLQQGFDSQVIEDKDIINVKRFKSIYEERIKLFKYTAELLKEFGYIVDLDAVICLLNENAKESHGGTQLICDDILQDIVMVAIERPEIIAGIKEGKVYIKYKNISAILKSQYNGYGIVDILDVLNEGNYISCHSRKRKDGGLRYQKRYEEQETLCLQNVPDKSLDEITKKYDEYKNKKGKSNGEKR